jgi:hypothetical protein
MNKQEFLLLANCKRSIFEFAEHVYIIHPIQGKILFKLYPFQKSVLWSFLNNRFVIVLKARQMGLTELIALYVLWLGSFFPYKNIQIISLKDRVAKKVMRRIKFMYMNLPDILKTPIINGNRGDMGTASEILFSNNSSIVSIPTTEDAGRSEAVSLLIMDEAAIMQYAENIWASAFPTLACISGSYEILVKRFVKKPRRKDRYKRVIETVKIEDLSPKEKGIKSLIKDDLYTLTHKGEWKRINYSQNKGLMETWEVKDGRGKTLECTPKHRLLTPYGWHTVEDIVKEGLDIIQVDLGLDSLKAKVVIPDPQKRVVKPIKGFPRHYISNFGEVYRKYNRSGVTVKVKPHESHNGSYDVGLTREVGQKMKTFTKKVSRLVAETFLGAIPKHLVVDHINCNNKDNRVTNLQLISYSENTTRSQDYSLGARLSTIADKIDPELSGKILNYKALNPSLSHEGIRSKLSSQDNIKVGRKTIGNHLSRDRVYLSKLTFIRTFETLIYDINVEGHNSYILPYDNFINHNTGGSAIVNSCITGDTKIIGEKETFRIDSIAPKKFGVKDLSHLNIRVLSHRGEWRRVLGAVNKGELETWEVRDEFGGTLKCTPNHKLLTPQGWETVQNIVNQGLNTILYDSGLSGLETPPKTNPPNKEEIKDIPGFPNYAISNLGKVYIKKGETLVEKLSRLNSWGYHSISLWDKNSKKKVTISRLVASVFIGDIPKGYVVDHIDCNPLNNHVNNLQIITISENGKRAAKYSRPLILGTRIGKKFPNLQLSGLIAEKHAKYGAHYGSSIKIAKECSKELGYKVDRGYVQGRVRGYKGYSIDISKLSLIRKYRDTIYDISVEEDQSYITSSKFVSHNTPFGVAGFYYQTWSEALLNANGFTPLKISWDLHPDRDINWYTSMRQALGAKRTAQEIDCDFLASGDTVFDLADIKDIEEELQFSPPIEKRLNGNLLIFKRPVPGERYFIGGDVSTGRAADYSSFSVMNALGEEFAAFKGRIPLNRYSSLLASTGMEYNRALLAPEANDIGEAVISYLQLNGYNNLYYTTKLIKEKGSNKPKVLKVPGWFTTSKTRPIIINKLEEDIREGTVNILNPFFTNEAYTFVYDEMNRPVAMNKGEALGDGSETYADDAIMGEAITNFIRSGKQIPLEMIPPK